jgi:hypothetical protein
MLFSIHIILLASKIFFDTVALYIPEEYKNSQPVHLRERGRHSYPTFTFQFISGQLGVLELHCIRTGHECALADRKVCPNWLLKALNFHVAKEKKVCENCVGSRGHEMLPKCQGAKAVRCSQLTAWWGLGKCEVFPNCSSSGGHEVFPNCLDSGDHELSLTVQVAETMKCSLTVQVAQTMKCALSVQVAETI